MKIFLHAIPLILLQFVLIGCSIKESFPGSTSDQVWTAMKATAVTGLPERPLHETMDGHRQLRRHRRGVPCHRDRSFARTHPAASHDESPLRADCLDLHSRASRWRSSCRLHPESRRQSADEVPVRGRAVLRGDEDASGTSRHDRSRRGLIERIVQTRTRDRAISGNFFDFECIPASYPCLLRLTSDNSEVNGESMVGPIHDRIPPSSKTVWAQIPDIDVLATCRVA